VTSRPETKAKEVVQHRQRSRRESEFVRVEDVIPAEILDDDAVDREYLAEVFKNPRKFLPPPRLTPRTRDEQMREPEHPFARRAKLAGLVLAVALLIGAIVVAATKNQSTATQSGWAAALNGFTISAAPEARGGSGAAAKPAPTSASTPSSTSAPAASATPAPGGPQVTPAADDSPGSAGANEKIAAVRAFYRTMDQRPKDALSLLDPVLSTVQAQSLLDAWQQMDSIEVSQAQVQPDGTVLAVVTMIQRDGVRLRLTQSLRLAAGKPGVISEVRLLSAERLGIR
jgi:hypothetical protein